MKIDAPFKMVSNLETGLVSKGLKNVKQSLEPVLFPNKENKCTVHLPGLWNTC